MTRPTLGSCRSTIASSYVRAMSEAGHVPLRLGRRRVERRGIDPHSCEPPFFLPICLNPQSIQPSPALLNRPLLTWQQSTSLPYPSLLAQLSCECIHTVEQLQQYANLHAPAGPSTIVVRLPVPQSCVQEATRVLVCALDGESETRRVVSGVRWWQVRPGDGG